MRGTLRAVGLNELLGAPILARHEVHISSMNISC